MDITKMDDPYVQFVLQMIADCERMHPDSERVFAAFFTEWLRWALDRAFGHPTID
jgi:hypothetical protein